MEHHRCGSGSNISKQPDPENRNRKYALTSDSLNIHLLKLRSWYYYIPDGNIEHDAHV